jgi:hypothetical protein
MPRLAFDWTTRRISLALAIVAGLAVVLTIADPGITVDEPLDVRPGRTYVSTILNKGLHFFNRATVDRVFLDNKEHPPLGRWLLGVASTLGQPFESVRYGPDPTGVYVISGRFAPAMVFALLVAAIAAEAGRLYGRAAAFAAGFATLVMPRNFGHAHLGALDTFIASFWCLALIRAERALESDRPAHAMAAAGLFWGLALLTKIHAWLLPPVVLIRALVRPGPRRGLLPLAIWTGIGLMVFFAGWPWLWYDTLGRLRGFLGTGVERTSIYVQYFGHVYRDRDVPWHFPWLHFLATVPVGLHVLGVVGLIGALRGRDLAALTYAGAIALVLGVFSTDVPVYDGERLYLLVFPLWALLIGRGFAFLCGPGSAHRSEAGGRWADPTLRNSLLTLLLLAQSFGLLTHHPYNLSYYNLLVGGLPGAERLGLELAYWSESVDRRLLGKLNSQMPPGPTAALAPTLAPGQGAFATGRALVSRKAFLDDEDKAMADDFLVVYRRTAYWKPEIKSIIREGETFAENTRHGVWLSRLIRRAKRGSPPVQRGGNS